MKPSLPIPTRKAAGVLLALLAFASAWPSAARAGCRHPGTADARPQAARLDLLEGLGTFAPEAPARPSPCDGLRCSSDPAPASPTTVAPASRVDRWVHLAVPHPPAAPGTSRLATPSPALRPSHGGPTPFHPPR